jgi:hypothetical protein
MRRLALTAAIILSASGVLLAQEWMDYENKEDRFTVNFPGQPKVETLTWPSEYGATFQGRTYSVTVPGGARYAITVIDYTQSRQRHAELQKNQANQQVMYADIDTMASIQYAATRLYRKKPGATVTYDAWHYIDLVEGHQLQVTNADGSRTFASIYLHENRLYILDATVPRGAPQPGLFQQSLSFLDEKGERVRYNEIYSNRLPPRPARGAGQGGGGGRGNNQ